MSPKNWQAFPTPHSAWKSLKDQNVLPAVQNQDGTTEVPDYIAPTASSGEPVPHVCPKVPARGDKTLLDATALERIKQNTGFVLWTAPTRAVYEQTLRAFMAREHPYRQMLEGISGGKVRET